MAPQAIWMLRVVANVRGRKEGEVPVLGDVPVEGVKGVEEDEEEPETMVRILLIFAAKMGRSGVKILEHTIDEKAQFPKSPSWSDHSPSATH